MNQEWLMIDMHMHSEYSSYRKASDKGRVKKMTPGEYIDILLSKGVKIFSITDHNYFSKEYYDSIEKYVKDNNLPIKIINGVECDSYVKLKDGKTNFIHVCLYFDDSTDRENLEKIITKLYTDENGNEKKPFFCDILNELSELHTKMIIIPHGDKDRGLLKSKFIDRLSLDSLPEYYKYAMYKIFNAYDVKPNFSESSINHWAGNFYEKTEKYNTYIENKSEEELEQLEKNLTSKIKDKNYILNDEENEIYNFILKYGSYFSYFSFSDWHNKEEYNPEINNFIFGSLDYAFSSFEMATLDPVSRIIKTTDASIEIPDTILKNVSFKIDGKEKIVNFSPGLNAIVGKRGSGKSLLLAVIKNLENKDDDKGAIKAYKSLNISDIKGINRGNIDISPGSLSSVAFLTQEQIKEVFENPNFAQKQISSYFKDINSIDLSPFKKIISIGKNIKPFNKNYKNITSNILSIKKLNDYNYTNLEYISDIKIKDNFNKITSEYRDLINNINDINMNTNLLKNNEKEFIRLKNAYLKSIALYNNIIESQNNLIKEINSKRTNNQITNVQNINDIKNYLKEISDNFEIQLNVNKLNVELKNFSIDNPPVEIFKKGKYLFVTYYDIPEDIKDKNEEMIYSTIKRGTEITDIERYINNDNSKSLKDKYNSIVDELEKFISGKVFSPKKEFYEITDNRLDVDNIESIADLKQFESIKYVKNLSFTSPGTKSVAYLDMLFDLDDKILILDQPEDNIDNDYISNYLVPNIKEKKLIKQLIFVTHNPTVAVYGDAFNYIYVENNDMNFNYTNYLIENVEDKEKLINILEGGRPSFSNRNQKFGNVIGEDNYAID